MNRESDRKGKHVRLFLLKSMSHADWFKWDKTQSKEIKSMIPVIMNCVTTLSMMTVHHVRCN